LPIFALLLLPAVLLAQQGAKPPTPGDRELEKAIRDRFARSKIARNGFQVQVQGGVATLTGQTDVIQHKGVATRLAKTVGAKQVINRIQVSEAARQKASANLATGRRRAQIKRSETSPPRSERNHH
jgi:osmotically-inducible protein OsmY